MKRPWLAFTLSFLLPGAGLCYLGKWGWGILNLLAVLATGIALATALSEDAFDEYRGPIAAGLGGGSAAFAKGMAEVINKRKAEEAAIEPT